MEKIISISSLIHDSGLSILENGSIFQTILSERISRKKHDESIIPVVKKYLKDIFDLGNLNVSNFSYYNSELKENINELTKIFGSNCLNISSKDHHLSHAYCGFYSSNFDDAICIVMDGNGSYYDNIIDGELCSEIESVFLFKDKKFNKVISKKYTTHRCSDSVHKILNDNVTRDMSIGQNYVFHCKQIGMTSHECGKFMGLAQYKFNEHKLPKEYSDKEWLDKVDYAYDVQKKFEYNVLEVIKTNIESTGIKNVVLSGGLFLNCVSNYNILKKLDNVNIHVDPICADNGISIGNALISYCNMTNKIPNKIISPYLGHEEKKLKQKILFLDKNFITSSVDYSDVVNLLLDKNVVGLFQGKSEVGQRSLGNRSILFDPRIVDGKSIVNLIKKRENYRPFAATVLHEYADDWFDIKKNTDFFSMSFAVDAYPKAQNLVPAVIHADNTSRIQTITKKQNVHFYNLINTFYEKTEVPMLLNTSLNLAGEPLVETFNDAINVLKNSNLKYLYFPEVGFLVEHKK